VGDFVGLPLGPGVGGGGTGAVVAGTGEPGRTEP